MRLLDRLRLWYARGRPALAIPRAQRWRDVFSWDATPVLLGPPSLSAMCLASVIAGHYESLISFLPLLGADLFFLYDMLAPAMKPDGVPYKMLQALDRQGWTPLLTEELTYVFHKQAQGNVQCVIFRTRTGYWTCIVANSAAIGDSRAVLNCPALLPLCSARTPQEMARRVDLRHSLNPDEW